MLDMEKIHEEAHRIAKEHTECSFPDLDCWEAKEHYKRIYQGELGKMTRPPVNTRILRGK